MTEPAPPEKSEHEPTPDSPPKLVDAEAPSKPHEPVSPQSLAPELYPKRLLPPSLSSTYPHGLITNEPRTPSQQTLFENRKQEILRTMSDEEIEASYRETVQHVEAVLREIKEGNEKIDQDVATKMKTRETERKAWARVPRTTGP